MTESTLDRAGVVPEAAQYRVGTAVDDGGCHPLFAAYPVSVSAKKLRKRLIREMRAAIEDYGMAGAGQRWLVCLSGGKDSYALLSLLHDLKWRGLLDVELLACNLDQGQPGFPTQTLPRFFKRFGLRHHIETQDTFSIVTDKIPADRTYCSLCARLRRGILYRVAREHGCQAVVLGHHGDDILETFFLNLFHGGRLATMPAKLVNEDGDLTVLRPLAYCAEEDLAKFAQNMRCPIVPCNLCGSQDGLQRQEIKTMLAGWERAAPGRKRVMLKALANVRPSHLMDRALFDFSALAPSSPRPSTGGDAEVAPCQAVAAQLALLKA